MIRGEGKPVQLLPPTWFLLSQPWFLTSWYYSFYLSKKRREERPRETCPAVSEDCWTWCFFLCPLLEGHPSKHKTHWAVGTVKAMRSGGRWTPFSHLESPRSTLWFSPLSNSLDWVLPPILIPDSVPPSKALCSCPASIISGKLGLLETFLLPILIAGEKRQPRHPAYRNEKRQVQW